MFWTHVAVGVLVYTLGLHYKFLGGTLVEGLTSNTYLIAVLNALWRRQIRKAMTREGIPVPDRTVEFAPGLVLDVFMPKFNDMDGTSRPCALYFHAGAFILGGREFGAGNMSWLASYGVVGISVGYQLTTSGDGVAGAMTSAWQALHWVRAHALELGVDAAQIFVMGDSAGGLLALNLAAGLGVNGLDCPPAPVEELPAAAVVGWPVVTLGSRTWAPKLTESGDWEETPEAAQFEHPNMFVPPSAGMTAAAARQQIQRVLAGNFFCWGRRYCGMLPASTLYPIGDDAASVSPVTLASRPSLPPIMILAGASDKTVPCSQQLFFADMARAVGNAVCVLVFEDADHGGGGLNSEAGRQAVLRFLKKAGFALRRPAPDEKDPAEFINGATRAFGIPSFEFENAPASDECFSGLKTLRLSKL